MKRIQLILLSLILCVVTTACGHTHKWKDATCATPLVCEECGETSGEPLGHAWDMATCTKPKTCSRCGSTDGEPLGHDFSGQSCTDDGVCSRCGEKTKALGHDWAEATCTEPKKCKRCGSTEGKALGHRPAKAVREDEKSATCTEKGSYVEVVYCSVCNAEISRKTVSVPALGHTTSNGTCSRCGKHFIEPRVFSGTGDYVFSNIDVPQNVYKVSMTYSGDRNFIVVAYTKTGKRISSLANEIGSYEGSVFLSDDIDGGKLEIKSSGSWTITFDAIPEGGTSNLSGSGDWVSPWFYLEEGALTVSLDYRGDSNFIVILYDEYGKRYSSLANEIGSYSGSTVFNRGKKDVKYCIEVKSSGSWTVDFGLGDKQTSK